MIHFLGGRSAVAAMAVSILLPFGSADAQGLSPLDEVNPRAEFSSVSRAYSDMDARYARTGVPREIAQVRSIEVGQSQAELEATLGRPALDHGDGSFEFHLSLPLAQSDRLICQYRVFLNGDGRVERAVWRRPQCADLVNAPLE
jgi:outer membrane protein assembly factor BamE (lipoprotein component of BamABCDE complex)